MTRRSRSNSAIPLCSPHRREVVAPVAVKRLRRAWCSPLRLKWTRRSCKARSEGLLGMACSFPLAILTAQ